MSSSVWGCGLKFRGNLTIRSCSEVILRVRMWIEIGDIYAGLATIGVILRVRMWIEMDHNLLKKERSSVILRVRMWIEIHHKKDVCTQINVILRVRMWIEILASEEILWSFSCHPPCEDVDWNLESTSWNDRRHESSSVWGCGLKFEVQTVWQGCVLSSSVWGCGLKYVEVLIDIHRARVILRVRMWIEILSVIYRYNTNRSHPPCEDVDWNIF